MINYKRQALIGFTKGHGLYAEAIQKIEGTSCNHTFIIYFDTRKIQWSVGEMLTKGFTPTDADKWFAANMIHVVGLARLQCTDQQADKFNDFINTLAYLRPKYDILGIAGFLGKWLRKLNVRGAFYCSEAAEKGSDYCGYRICPGRDIRVVSPEDQFAMMGKTLSQNLWIK